MSRSRRYNDSFYVTAPSPLLYGAYWLQLRREARGRNSSPQRDMDLPIKPVSRRPGFKTNMQSIVSARQSLDRSLDRQRARQQAIR
jgi:hypothetical protein